MSIFFVLLQECAAKKLMNHKVRNSSSENYYRYVVSVILNITQINFDTIYKMTVSFLFLKIY